jgi:Zn-dependent protease with chaperone function
MSVPLSTLLGLLALFVAVELERPIPGSAVAAQTIVFAAGLAIPLLLLVPARRLLEAAILAGRKPMIPPRALLNLSTLSVPMVLWAFFGPGGAAEWIDRLPFGGSTLKFALYGLPLVAIEVPRLAMATVLSLWAEVADELGGRAVVSPSFLPRLAQVWPIARLRLGWLALIALPQLLLGAALDLVALDPRVEGVVRITGFGGAVAALLFLIVVASVLPWWFRVAFRVQPLPEPLGGKLRAVANRLGFRGRLFLLPTGNRALNAMMVGPLPIQRGLGLTDAFVEALDEHVLAGVVAHEVGHARREHPFLLVCVAVVVPMLLYAPLSALRIDEWPPSAQIAFGLGFVAILWWSVRTLAHRFELEADAASVEALGASPCTQALRSVQAMAIPHAPGFLGRIASLHPDDTTRQERMWRYEADPKYRAAFARTGRRVRAVLATVVLVATAIAAVAWWREWPYERAFVAFHRGDLVAAQALRDQVDATVPEHWREAWQRFGETLRIARAIAPNARSWPETREAAAAAWSTAVEVLLRQGPAAASPWFDVVVGVAEAPPLVHRTIREYCHAAADLDPERMAAAAAVVRRLGSPPELAPVFAVGP